MVTWLDMFGNAVYTEALARQADDFATVRLAAGLKSECVDHMDDNEFAWIEAAFRAARAAGVC